MFRNAKRFAILALAAVTCAVAFTACTNDSATSDTIANTDSVQTNADTTDPAPTGSTLTSEFRIIYEDGSDKAASRVRNSLRDAIGSTPDSKKASAATGDYNYSFLIGNTGKTESNDFIASLKENEYGVKVITKENSIMILVAGKTSEINGYAVDLLINDYMPKEKGTAQLLKNDTTIMIYVPPVEPETPTGYGGIEFEEQIITVANVSGIPYTRMTKLQDGRLMMVYGWCSKIESPGGTCFSRRETLEDVMTAARILK